MTNQSDNMNRYPTAEVSEDADPIAQEQQPPDPVAQLEESAHNRNLRLCMVNAHLQHEIELLKTQLAEARAMVVALQSRSEAAK